MRTDLEICMKPNLLSPQEFARTGLAIRMPVRSFLLDWCGKAEETRLGQMVRMPKTPRSHAFGIMAHADYSITSGKLEGANNMIETLLSITCGLTDETYFTLKLLSLHDSKQQLLSINGYSFAPP